MICQCQCQHFLQIFLSGLILLSRQITSREECKVQDLDCFWWQKQTCGNFIKLRWYGNGGHDAQYLQ